MTEKDVLREIQQLKADMVAFNERVAGLRFDDFKKAFNSQMKDMMVGEARRLFEDGFWKAEGSSSCKAREECLASMRHIVDQSLDALSEDDQERSMDILGQAEEVFSSHCLRCEDGACGHAVLQSISRVKAVMAVYMKLANEMARPEKTIKEDERQAPLSPNDLELMLYPLSSAMRLKIMLILMQGDRTLSEISQNLKMKTGHLMFHVRALKENGYIASDERSRLYTLTERGRTALSCLRDMNSKIGASGNGHDPLRRPVKTILTR